MLLAVLVWIIFLWVGWLLIFAASERAIIHAANQEPATIYERIYFVGFTLSTLGTGDFQPNGPFWQVMTAVASFTGLFLVTFAIAYLVPVVQAAAEKRALAVRIASLGQSAPDILLNTCAPDSQGKIDCSALTPHLTSLTGDLALLEQRHLTYPVLHYLHSSKRPEGSALSVAALDEALTILAYGLHEDADGLAPGTAHPIRQVITEFLETLGGAHIARSENVPPPPSLAPLRDAGLPMSSQENFQKRLEALEGRRKLLLALVESDGWTWDLVHLPNRERAAATPLEQEKPRCRPS